MSIVPQCKEEILKKKYDCSLSKDKREKSRVECFYPQGKDIIILLLSKFTLGHSFTVDQFWAFRDSTPSRRMGFGDT